jgi:hypothetical protein
MPRRKTNAVPRLTKTVNVRVPSILDAEIRAECRRHDLPVSHFGRKSFLTIFGREAISMTQVPQREHQADRF